jgi:(p)ppGpp synthase/HD superfamily hydrolase
MTTTAHDLQARKDFGAGALTATFDDALQFAFERHRFHFRKGSRVPYLSHLMSVCALVLEHGGSQDQAIAALLHDAVEDAAPGQGPDVLQAIGGQFGAEVQCIVKACSDTVNDDEGGKACWTCRKVAYVAGLADPAVKPDAALLVTAADKIHNALSIARDLETYGEAFWGTFNASATDLLWYYTAVQEAIAKRLGAGHTVVKALERAVQELLDAAEVTRQLVPDQPSACRCAQDGGA